nr:unnamed protein product [Callosobruchus analis]
MGVILDIYCLVHRIGISLTNLKGIGCDGTNVNTGWKGGAIRLIEEQLERPLQWAICKKMDDHTKGPHNYLGPIGSLLNDCEKATIYLYIMCQAIKNGNGPQNLLERNPVKPAHSRWVSTDNPSENLKLITDFIMKHDASMWFKIKTKPLLHRGAQHIWEMIKISRQFPEAVRNMIDKIIVENSCFAQPENVLVAMLADPRERIRRLAVNRIKKARINTSKELRVFKAPKLNFDADDYIDFTDLQNVNVTEPPITKALTIEELTHSGSGKVCQSYNRGVLESMRK